MALVKELEDQMITGGFHMPLLVNLETNPNQLACFKEAIESNSTGYKDLEEEEARLNKKYLIFIKAN